MSQENVCYYNKFGFCKFGEKCFRLHENKICENGNCDIENCSLRHPRFCRYFGKFKKCKFGSYCKFRHEDEKSTSSDHKNCDEEIVTLKKRLEDCEGKIKEKEKEIKILDKILSEKICELSGLKNVEIENINLKTKVEELEDTLKEMRDKIDNLESENASLSNTVAVNDMLHEDFKERMKNKYLYDSDDEDSDYDSNEESREIAREAFRKKKQEKRYKEIGICKKSSFKCEKCDFIGKTEGGLKTHDRIKHREPK